ncbi:MAG: FAD:protein FMN transferase [Clostridia bacterium]|nr:FAD:protein FMN transferase [Clostridia bacterium]
MKNKLIWLICIVVAVFLLSQMVKRRADIDVDGALNTVSHITVVDNKAKSLAKKCAELINEYDGLFSVSDSQSDVYKINNSGDWVSVSPQTIDIISDSSEFFVQSQGRFDLTVGALSDLWNKGVVPEHEKIENLLSDVDFSFLQIDFKNSKIKRGNHKITLGAVAKGYIADRIADYLKEKNAYGAMINLGGNIYAHGTKAKNELWKVGITDPCDTSQLIGAVTVSDKFVVTSGDYERYFEYDGERYHHILDSETGYPAKSGLISTTIISDNGFLADALSTACFILGLEKGAELAHKYNVKIIFVTDDKKIYCSKGIGFDKKSDAYEYIEI